jgi:prephenate dehydrogenase
MCEGNRDALLAAVDDALGRLGVMRGALASTGGLAATVKAGYAGRMRWSATREPLEHQVSLTGPSVLAELREIGRRGEVVTGWA